MSDNAARQWRFYLDDMIGSSTILVCRCCSFMFPGSATSPQPGVSIAKTPKQPLQNLPNTSPIGRDVSLHPKTENC